MAKIYGNRWQITGSLGSGGQGDVFRVKDIAEKLSGEFALKRLRNPNRVARFHSEIEAVKRLDHQNIIKLVDHSALDVDIEMRDETNYLVMPIANGGDLTNRVASFKDSLDSTLVVAQRLASALANAHSAKVIHRDVKPENILFQDAGNEAVLLTDFGICLLRDADDRLTETSEAVGPRLFMAPELEGGLQLNVTPAVDIYSLGKLIYYMLTGGRRLPREGLASDPGAAIFTKSDRFQLLQILLSKMIAPLERRLKSLPEVLSGLKDVADWETRVASVDLGEASKKAIAKLRQSALENTTAIHASNETRKEEARLLEQTMGTLYPWLDAKLRQYAEVIGAGGIVTTDVRAATAMSTQMKNVGPGYAVATTGVELMVRSSGQFGHGDHLLQVWICRKITTTVSIGGQGNRMQATPFQDQQLVLIPRYQSITNQALSGFFLENAGPVGTRITNRFRKQSYALRTQKSLAFEFRVSQWPAVSEQLTKTLNTAVEHFVSAIDSGIFHIPD